VSKPSFRAQKSSWNLIVPESVQPTVGGRDAASVEATHGATKKVAHVFSACRQYSRPKCQLGWPMSYGK